MIDKSFVLICPDDGSVDTLLRKKKSFYECRCKVDQFTPTKNFILAVERPTGYYAKGYVAFIDAIVKYDSSQDRSCGVITFEFTFANPFIFDKPFSIEPDFFGLYHGPLPSGRCVCYNEISVRAIRNATSMYAGSDTNPVMQPYSISEDAVPFLKEAKELSHIPMRTLVPASAILYDEHIKSNIVDADSVIFTPRSKLRAISVYSPNEFIEAISDLEQIFRCDSGGVVLNAAVFYVHSLLSDEKKRIETSEHLNRIISRW